MPGGIEDDVSCSDVKGPDDLLYATRVDRLSKRLPAHVLLEAVDDPATVGVEDVPGLHLSEATETLVSRVAIAGVNLYGEVVAGIQELDEQGEFAAISVADGLAEELRVRARPSDARGPIRQTAPPTRRTPRLRRRDSSQDSPIDLSGGSALFRCLSSPRPPQITSR